MLNYLFSPPLHNLTTSAPSHSQPPHPTSIPTTLLPYPDIMSSVANLFMGALFKSVSFSKLYTVVTAAHCKIIISPCSQIVLQQPTVALVCTLHNSINNTVQFRCSTLQSIKILPSLDRSIMTYKLQYICLCLCDVALTYCTCLCNTSETN